MTGLRQRLELVQDKSGYAALVRSTIIATVADVDGILGTISALLRIAQVESGARKESFRPVDIGEVLSTVVEAYRPAF